MFESWRAFLALTDPNDPSAKEIQRIYNDGVNPYSGRFYERNGQPKKTQRSPGL
jgi:hypothetical protein